MGKIGLIIGREYLTKVKKKSFIIMTFLGPILMAAAMIIPAAIAMKSEDKPATVGVVDESSFYGDAFKDAGKVHFKYLSGNVEDQKPMLTSGELTYILYIPKSDSVFPTKAIMYGSGSIGIEVNSKIKSAMSEAIETDKLNNAGIDPKFIKNIKEDIEIKSFNIDEKGGEKRTYAETSQIIGAVCGILIYMFIMMYGSQVMRGVLEEKSSRIVEVIISSVKPFQLMMGKIIGVGLVGLTQFLLWIILTFVLVFAFGGSILGSSTMNSTFSQQMVQSIPSVSAGDTTSITASETDNIVSASENSIDNVSSFSAVMDAFNSINIPQILLLFLIYFIGGYLLYASMFAAVAGAIDNEDDLQQFTLPLTIFLVIPLFLMGNIISDPSGPVAMWLSMIPFTSPITMMVRLPFTVSGWQILLSIVLLIGCFIFMTWISGKIYRTGILMYGKKITWREVWKWIRY